MKSSKQHLTLRIAKLKEAIRRKYNSFKSGSVENEKLLEKKYRPIISEIKKAASSSHMFEPIVKTEPKKEESDEEGLEDEVDELPISSTPKDDERPGQLDNVLATPTGSETVTQFIEEHFDHPLTKKYMDMFMRDRGGKSTLIDHTYGPRYDGETLKVGDSELEFDDNGSILLNNTRYKATEGLYELLFKRTPDEDKYSDEDLAAYKDILMKTNAHKKGYKYSGIVNRNVSMKYKKIIADLFPVKKGSGMQWKSTRSRDIVHWDDPNELVDRLRLLTMSAETGNNSHTNEILNILEELREAGYIKGSGNKNFKALLK